MRLQTIQEESLKFHLTFPWLKWLYFQKPETSEIGAQNVLDVEVNETMKKKI